MQLALTEGVGVVDGLFASLGDSRLAQMFSDPSTQTVKNALHFFNQANARMGQRMQSLYQGAEAAKRPDEYVATYLSGVLSSGAKFVMVWSAINGILAATPQTADQLWFGWASGAGPAGASDTFIGLKSACDQILNAGMRPILFSEPGSTGTFGNGTYTARINTLNGYMSAYCAANPRAIYFDTNTVLLDNPTTPTAFKTNYCPDGTHTATLGAYYLGKAFQALMTPLLRSVAQGIGGTDLLPNRNFVTTTGGTVNAPATGTAPSGIQVFADAGATCAVSTVANADGYGNDVVFTCTFNASGQRITIRYALTPGDPVPGDIHQAGAEVSVDAGSSNFAGVFLQELMQVGAANTQVYDLFLDNTFGVGPTEQYTQVMRTKRNVSPSGITTWQLNLRAFSTGAGSATFRIRRVELQKLAA